VEFKGIEHLILRCFLIDFLMIELRRSSITTTSTRFSCLVRSKTYRKRSQLGPSRSNTASLLGGSPASVPPQTVPSRRTRSSTDRQEIGTHGGLFPADWVYAAGRIASRTAIASQSPARARCWKDSSVPICVHASASPE